MEQDIEILKELKNKYYKRGEVNLLPFSGAKYILALEHLIKAYKELEEENSLLIQQNITYKRNIHDLKHNNIPVSLVKEKIEELKEKGESDLKTYGFAIETHLAKQVLQELLEKRK